MKSFVGVPSAVALGTSLTAITGLSIPIPEAGLWSFEGYIYVVNVGSPTNTTYTLSPTSGPGTSALSYTWIRVSATAVMGSGHTAFNVTSGGTNASNLAAFLKGVVRTTGPGTLSVSGTRTGGTSATIQPDSYLSLERIA